ncbi:MAG: hypothetical protein JWO28_8 [Hyphomicrobiales bacterium]|nr:hypothetical protein [Hyphomicrobiales bacterium]
MAKAICRALLIVTASLSVAFVLPGVARAEEPNALNVPGLDLAVGVGLIMAPAFTGAEGQKISVAPYLNGSYKDVVDFDVLDGIRVNAVHAGDFSIGPAARYRYGRSSNDAAEALHGLGSIDDSLEMGGFIGFDNGLYSAEILALQDATGENSGFLVEGRASVGIPLGSGGLEIGPFIRYAGRTYMQTYYGVDAAQAAASGRSAYSPSAGFDLAGLQLNAMFPLGGRFSVRGFMEYDRLLGDATGSPFIERNGAQDQFSVGVFLVYAP